MSNEDILSVVQELPLHVLLKLKRNNYQPNCLLSPVYANENHESVVSNHESPNSVETKVILNRYYCFNKIPLFQQIN